MITISRGWKMNMKIFLNQFTTKNTQRMYRTHLNQYFKIIDADPDTYFDGERDYEADVRKFSIAISEKSPKSQKTKISCVKTFLIENDVELRERVWRGIRRRRNGNGVITIDKVPDPADLKKILHYGTSRARALFLTLASSGMRISEITGISWNEINFNNNPSQITIPADIAKNGNPRITFISDEAKECLLEWKKEREEYLKRACEKAQHSLNIAKSIDDERVFPFTTNNAVQMWNYMVERAGAPYNERDARTGRHKYHIHSLRKYFRT